MSILNYGFIYNKCHHFIEFRKKDPNFPEPAAICCESHFHSIGPIAAVDPAHLDQAPAFDGQNTVAVAASRWVGAPAYPRKSGATPGSACLLPTHLGMRHARGLVTTEGQSPSTFGGNAPLVTSEYILEEVTRKLSEKIRFPQRWLHNCASRSSLPRSASSLPTFPSALVEIQTTYLCWVPRWPAAESDFALAKVVERA